MNATIAGAEGPVGLNLLQAAGISLDCRKMGGKFILHSNLCGLELVFEQAQGVENDAIDINFGELRATGAREVQKIVDDL